MDELYLSKITLIQTERCLIVLIDSILVTFNGQFNVQWHSHRKRLCLTSSAELLYGEVIEGLLREV